MNKHIAIALCFISIGSLNSFYEYYQQQSRIFIHTNDLSAQNHLTNMLDKFNIRYECTDIIHPEDNQNLYIIAGDISSYTINTMPQHYIIYQTKALHNISSGHIIQLLSKAHVIWDAQWSNINQYRHRTPHWYYLPDEQYEFLDPVLLSCFLPLRALSTYKELLQHSNTHNTDFSSHIPVLFCHCFMKNPNICIESGIRWGDGSTIALSKITQLLDTQLIGLDIDNCSKHYAHIKNAQFIRIDDLQFPTYFRSNYKQNSVDFVFIDTSHEYEHTLNEIAAFNSILSDNGVLAFHDSNLAATNPVRLNGTTCMANNSKGVTDGLKTYFNFSFDENRYLNTYIEKDGYIWNLVNYPYCYGFALAKRIRKIEA